MASTQCQVRAGWSGRFYEDLAVGDVYRSRWGHTVTEADNALFTHLTHNTNPLHFDARYPAGTRPNCAACPASWSAAKRWPAWRWVRRSWWC